MCFSSVLWCGLLFSSFLGRFQLIPTLLEHQSKHLSHLGSLGFNLRLSDWILSELVCDDVGRGYFTLGRGLLEQRPSLASSWWLTCTRWGAVRRHLRLTLSLGFKRQIAVWWPPIKECQVVIVVLLAWGHFILILLGLRLLLASDQVHELVCHSRVLEVLRGQGWVICSLRDLLNLFLVLLPNDKFIQFGNLSNSLDRRLFWSSCGSLSIGGKTFWRLCLLIWGLFCWCLFPFRRIVLLRLFGTGTCGSLHRRSRVLCDITFNCPLREQNFGLQQWKCGLFLPWWYNLPRITIQIRHESILLFLLPLVLLKLGLFLLL